MAINKNKLTKEQIILSLKKKTKRNLTISLDEPLIKKFKKECEKHGLKMNQVLQKLMEEFCQ